MPNDWTSADDEPRQAGEDGELESPYAPPKAQFGDEGASQGSPDVAVIPPIYSPQGVAIGTFLGGPLATTALMAMNFSRVGDDRKRNLAILIGAAASIGLIAMALAIPDGVGNSIPLLNTAIGYGIAKSQHDKLEAQVGATLPEASRWKAAGIGLVCLLATGCVVFGVAFTAGVMGAASG